MGVKQRQQFEFFGGQFFAGFAAANFEAFRVDGLGAAITDRDFKVLATENLFEAKENVRIVLDNENSRLHCSSSFGFCPFSGRTKVKQLPPPKRAWQVTSPPWARAIWRASVRPRP